MDSFRLLPSTEIDNTSAIPGLAELLPKIPHIDQTAINRAKQHMAEYLADNGWQFMHAADKIFHFRSIIGRTPLDCVPAALPEAESGSYATTKDSAEYLAFVDVTGNASNYIGAVLDNFNILPQGEDLVQYLATCKAKYRQEVTPLADGIDRPATPVYDAIITNIALDQFIIGLGGESLLKEVNVRAACSLPQFQRAIKSGDTFQPYMH